MEGTTFIYPVFLIFTCAAVLATLALYTRQSLLVAYMLLGIMLGPSGFKLVPQLPLARELGDIGIIFLLFLLGLDLSPKDLLHTLRATSEVTVISSLIFAAVGFWVGYLFGFNVNECAIIGIALVFSSTIIGLKLLPTTVLHRQPTGEILISALLLQDLIAIAILILVRGTDLTGSKFVDIALTTITLPALTAFAFIVQRFVIAKLFARFDRVKEYIFLLALGWCLGLGELARLIGLPAEIGAFLAGVAIAEGPIALYIAQSLKPLRDFCLVMFFFAIGASFDLHYLPHIWLPALLLAALVVTVKPWLMSSLLHWRGTPKAIAQEAGLRLGQASEFSLLIAYLAAERTPQLISDKAGNLIQAVTLLTFIVSSYIIVLRYPTPIAFSDHLRKD